MKHVENNHHDAEDQVDRLITRIVDGEATAEDQRAFESLAAAQPQLWPDLATQLQQMRELSNEVSNEVASAVAIELPEGVSGADSRAASGGSTSGAASGGSWKWAWAVSGWAAVIALCALWVITATRTQPNVDTQPRAVPAAEKLSPDEHLRHYAAAPWVIGEMQPVLLNIEELENGDVRLRIVRRFEEYAYFSADEPLPIDEHNRLNINAAELRKHQVHGPSPRSN